MMNKVDLEIYYQGAWHKAATFSVATDQALDKGYLGEGLLAYKENYVLENTTSTPNHALSVNYPVTFSFSNLQNWPAFMLDILPAGAGRRALLNLHNMPERQARSDWFLLNCGASCPPGNIRIAQAVSPEAQLGHPGFDKQKVIERGDQFLEYARSHGAPVSGSTGAQGDAPKFLLTVDKHGKWHADGALSDQKAIKHYLVKFPRGKSPDDLKILRYEAAYHKIAGSLGLRTFGKLQWEKNTLFIPRFDRERENNIILRHGMESLCSAANVADFGQAIDLFRLCQSFLPHVTNPTQELTEFLKRDALNLALGNTDNHARNTALIKYEDGRVSLSPLFDFAPMIFDPEGIVRTCKWKEAEHLGSVSWKEVISKLQKENKTLNIDFNIITQALQNFAKTLEQTPELLRQNEIDKTFIKFLTPKIQAIISGLQEI